ncbi:MAG: hypothetical protein LBD37_05735 [Treponema sp.]|jgi:hypothetical protein|nr:hypothetical protein [Treponema sp.]
MKTTRQNVCILILGLLGLGLASCELDVPKESAGDKYYPERPREQFNAYNMKTQQYYTLEAVHLAETGRCAVFGETGAGLSLEAAERIAKRFEERIFPDITGFFGQGQTYTIGPENKLTLLLLDIRDDYRPNQNAAYTAGYFSANDMPGFGESSRSNQRIMLYLDVAPGSPESEGFYATIAHELQHCLNFAISVDNRIQWKDKERMIPLVENGRITGCQEEWLDEGLSSAAEYLYARDHQWTKVKYFNAVHTHYIENQDFYPSSRISQGNTFYVWSHDDFVYDEYVTAYLFFQWLRIHASNGAKIYRDIIHSDKTGYEAVTGAAAKYIDPRFSSWETLLETWHLANYVNAPKGFYGYKGELEIKTAAIKNTSIPLAAGEGVFSNLVDSTFTAPGGAASIRYTGINAAGEAVGLQSGGPYQKGDRLLTFNVSQNNAAALTETGKLTGRGDLPASEAGRSALPGGLSGPFPIDRRIPYTE